jgi:hypothetical protein
MRELDRNTVVARSGNGVHWFRQLLISLLLVGCCFWTSLAGWLFAPLMPFLANRLSYVRGKAEVIAPAQ